MKTVAFFNNKGGVGKTWLVYHLAWMFAQQGVRVVAADLDPQANLTSICLAEERLEELWAQPTRPTVFSALEPVKRGVGDVVSFDPEPIGDAFGLVVGDLSLSEIEDELSAQWRLCVDRDERAFRVTTAFDRIVRGSAARFGADLALLDVGPNLGAINRAALIGADFIVVPVAPDLFSVQGLSNVGPRLRDWRREWTDRRERAPKLDFSLPAGALKPIGYVVSRHSIFAGGPVKAFSRWLDRVPLVYRRDVLDLPGDAVSPDPERLAQLRDYRSLMPMAQAARKPMFLLKPGDGAIGGHQSAVRDCYQDFKVLAGEIAHRIGLGQG